MTQPIPTTIERDGIAAHRFFYPEDGTTLIEYHDDGCLVMLGDPDSWGKRSLNVRLNDADASVAAFNRLRAAMVRACHRHGFTPQSEKGDRRFFDQTRGWGVLWAQAEK